MKSLKTPTPEDVSKTVALLSRAANYRHFFEKLENPAWIEPLWNKGFFKHPPKVEYEDDRQGYMFPRWPESRYLARMAQHAPRLVARVLLGIVETDNIAVREDIARAVLALPVNLAEAFVNAARQWIAGRFFDKFLAMRLGELVSHLSKDGKKDAALDLARELLQVVSRDRRGNGAAEPSPFDFPPEPVARFDTWNYEQLLKKNVPHLVDEAKFDAIVLLCDLLDEAVGIKEHYQEGTERVDFSYIWRPAIEDHGQNLGNTVLDALISSLRDMVERLCKADPKSIPALLEMLEKREWPVFQRIGLYVLSRFVHEEPLLVEERIIDEALFDNHLVLHEYHYLCRFGFPFLTPEARQKLLGWIDGGLEREEVEKSIRSRGHDPSEKIVDQLINGWRLDRLTPIKDHLTGQWADHYDRLIQQRGEPEHPDFALWYERQAGPKSPLTQHELSEMPVENILTFMRTWEPPVDSPKGPSPEGFGRTLSAVVAVHPNDFAVSADEFRGLEPTYVRSLLCGLENALGNGRHFDWKPVLALCEWVVEQPQSIPGRQVRSWEKDSDWGWTRGRIADLLTQGLVPAEGGIPLEYRSSIWKVLEPLTRDPYPPSKSEHDGSEAWRGPSWDSLNTTRGKAMHAVIRYAVWAKNNIDKNLPTEDRTAQGFTIMPEVQEVLDSHLDPAVDASPATRSVYGQWLPALGWVDKDWVVKNLETLFPSDESQDYLWRAAWDGYVSFQVHLSVLDILRKQYKRAIDAMGLESTSDYFRSDPDSNLAEHLMIAYWNGRESLVDQDSLVRTFFERAPLKIREHALYLIGSWLNNYSGDLGSEITKRLTDLWQWRKATHQGSNDAVDSKELAQFGWWFVSGKLDQRWSLQQVLLTVQICVELDSSFQVVERLAALGKDFPDLVVDCLEALVQHTKKIWRIYSWREQAFRALQSVIESDHPETRQKARRVINRFGELGFRDFKSLLDVPDAAK
jgi:hypothetical protein